MEIPKIESLFDEAKNGNHGYTKFLEIADTWKNGWEVSWILTGIHKQGIFEFPPGHKP
ncbi:MAG TPA: hypothetical protein VMW63_05735 [Methanoregulaceae archaeon]|nr:hypothetical protein [Methanoregulaceae archaeon]